MTARLLILNGPNLNLLGLREPEIYGAYTHTSVAILDALRAFEGKVIELHLTNTHRREEFRHLSYVSFRADGVIMGFGAPGYLMALDAAADMAARDAAAGMTTRDARA